MRTTVAVSIFLLILESVLAVLPAGASPVYQLCNQVAITSPESGADLRGAVTVAGSASIGDFQFYKVEYATAAQPDLWRAVSQTYSQPVINGPLDRWNTTVLPDGEGYSLKLTAVDVRGQEVCRDVVRDLTIANTEPTTTPTPETPPTLPGPTATSTPRATATPAPPTPTPTVLAIIPTRESTFPEIDTIRDTVTGAFNLDRLQSLLLLGAGTTAAVFVFIGVISLLRRLI